jgi:hypothetical protein
VDPQSLKGTFGIALTIFLAAAAMLPFQPRGSAEFVVTTLAAAIGAIFILAIAVVARWANPRPPEPSDRAARTIYNVSRGSPAGRAGRSSATRRDG